MNENVLVNTPLKLLAKYMLQPHGIDGVWCDLDVKDASLAELLKLKDPLEIYIHVEMPDELALKEGIKPRIWEIKSWQDSYNRHLRVKAYAEEQRKERAYLFDKFKELVDVMQEFHEYDELVAKIVANNIIYDKNIESRKFKAKQYDVDI